MANVVFILGAGASKQAGGPLMSDFLDIADDLWKSNVVIGGQPQYFSRVFAAIGALQAVHSKAQLDLGNIESVFNALEMARILRKFPGPESASVEEAIEALKYVITLTLEHRIRFPVVSKQVAPPVPYPEFAQLIQYVINDARPKRSVAVLTFNYDMAADYALFTHGLGPDYCLGSQKTGGIPLLKLHGSINWAVCGKCGGVFPWHLGNFFKGRFYPSRDDVRDVGLDIWSHFSELQHCGTPVQPLPFLVPPTWNKTDHHETIQVVWERAAKELTDAENIFVVGYSLPETDGFFRTLYALGTAGGTPLKRFWVFDPDQSGAVQGRFRALIGPGAAARFFYFPHIFSDAVTVIREALSQKK